MKQARPRYTDSHATTLWPSPEKALRLPILSDLHLERGNSPPAPAADVDVLVVAGDPGPVTQPWLLSEAVEQWRAAPHILYVPGNHESFGSDIDEARRFLARHCETLGVQLLDPGATDIEGVRVGQAARLLHATAALRDCLHPRVTAKRGRERTPQQGRMRDAPSPRASRPTDRLRGRARC